MRAWQVDKLGEPEAILQMIEAVPPEPGPGEIRVRVGAVALGLPDVFMCRGTYLLQPSIPFTPGQEIVGTVTAVGKGAVTTVRSRVMAVTAFLDGHGGFAEEALAYDQTVYRAPDDMTDVEAAAFFIPFQTAHIALVQRGQLNAKETLLVHGGAGGVGSAAIQLGRALGAKVIATAGGSNKTRACLDLGADIAIDYHSEDFVGRVLALTEGRGADVIFDPVGGEVFDRSRGCVANEGRLLVIGYASGAFSSVPTDDIVLRNYSVVGVFVGAYGHAVLSSAHEELLKFWKEGRIRSVVRREIAFEQIPQALTDLANRNAVGRVVARMSEQF